MPLDPPASAQHTAGEIAPVGQDTGRAGLYDALRTAGTAYLRTVGEALAAHQRNETGPNTDAGTEAEETSCHATRPTSATKPNRHSGGGRLDTLIWHSVSACRTVSCRRTEG